MVDSVQEHLAGLQRQMDHITEVILKSQGYDPGLYVRRRLLPISATNLERWARGQGFIDIMEPRDFHATVIYSRRSIPWQCRADTVVVPGQWPLESIGRAVEPLGDQGAVVLRFECPVLQARWRGAMDRGAMHDHEGGYKPHVTITWAAGDLDLARVQPYWGELQFGPEVAGPVRDNWRRMDDTV